MLMLKRIRLTVNIVTFVKKRMILCGDCDIRQGALPEYERRTR